MPLLKATHDGKGEWVPIKPTTDAYFLLGMIRWMMENNGYKKEISPSQMKRGLKKKGYRNWTDMTYLVSTKEPKHILQGRMPVLARAITLFL